MPNGKPGDHPLNDVVDHGRSVFSDEVDALVRELAARMPREDMWELFDWFSPPPLAELAERLRAVLGELQRRDSGS